MRNRMTPLAGSLVALAALALQAPAAHAQVDMTGTWSLEVDVAGQISNPSMTLEQDGTALTGTYSSAQLGEADVTGTVDDNTVVVTFEVSAGGLGGTVEYAGTVDDDGVWAGSFSVSGLADGTFTGTKE